VKTGDGNKLRVLFFESHSLYDQTQCCEVKKKPLSFFLYSLKALEPLEPLEPLDFIEVFVVPEWLWVHKYKRHVQNHL
jgi:hypothetical protein